MENLTASLFSALTPNQVIDYGTRLMIIFLITPLHEFAHAWMATKQGDDTPRLQGRLTLNPLAHVDLLGSLCLLLGGFGWGKPVQVNPLRFKQYRKGMMLTAAAGPISNLIVGLVGMILYKTTSYIGIYADLSYRAAVIFGWLTLIFYYFTIINLGLAVFNLIPVPPLDGSKIFSYFAGRKYDEFMYRYQTAIAIAFIFVIATPILQTPLGFLRGLIFNLMDKLTFFVDLIAKAVIG